jgi:hypothetical protein
MKACTLFLCLLALLLPLAALAEETRLRCIADTNLSSYESERDFNYGQSTRLRLKGIQMMALFRFDTAPVKDWRVEKATLYLRYAGNDRKLRTLGLSTVSAPWEEGTGAGERKPGEVCFMWRALGKERWAGPDTDFTDVSFTAGNTLAAYADVKDVGDGWIAVDVPARLAQAMIAGVTYGLAVTDEKGQTMANNDVYSREQSASAPYMVVVGRPVAAARPYPVRDLAAAPEPGRADFAHGALRLTFTAPSGALAYDVRYTLPDGTVGLAARYALPFAAPGEQQSILLDGLPPDANVTVGITSWSETGARGQAAVINGKASAAKFKPAPLTIPSVSAASGQEPQAYGGAFRVWAYPDTEKAHPVGGSLLEEAGPERYAGAPTGGYRRDNSVWDGRIIQLAAARNEFVAFHLLIEAANGSLKGVRVRGLDALAGASGGSLKPLRAFYRDWYVKDGEWFPEVCVPLNGAFDIPAADNGIPGQRNQSLFVEMLVPKEAAPGRYTGEIAVSAEGVPPVKIPVTLTVNALTLPDTLSFDISLNTYGTMGHLFGLDDRTPEYRALEREYHRMAHLHRATLAVLGYSHSGNITTNYAPPLEGGGAATRVSDWSAWDAQFGPYLDGSAFAGLPRAGVPVTHLYLPFHEAWPADIRKHYNYQQTVAEYPAMIVEHAMKAPPIEEAMDKEFGDEFKAVVRQFAEHFREKGWTKTQFQFYNNDKYYYKDPKQGGRGTSWWLLDEPNHRDDWLALAYFARLFREGMKGFAGVPILHREDISRPQWQRDYLDELVDLMVVGGELYNKGPLLRDYQRKGGVRYWNYASANPVRQTNLSMEAWAVRAWLAGAEALVPWQSVGGDENYTKPDETALLLPGRRFGIMGPVASLRLKALRRAQQDAEYLALLAKGKGWDRDQVAAAIADLVKLKGTFEQENAEDAGRFRFGPLRAADFAALRRAIAAALQ